MSLSPEFLDELRHRTSLSALIGRSTKLQKAGHEFRACCPFHNEKTPSFYVNDDKGFYHCFGCSAHGDAIRWMTDHRGLSFIDAVRELAEAAGMELPAIDRVSAQRSERARGIHDACAAAAAWFGDQLGAPGGAAARAMLQARGITAASIGSFGLGFAPDARSRLRSALSNLGDPLLIEAGLLIDGRANADPAPYDRFRGRIMIPIRDPRGRPIAFGGRIISSGGTSAASGGSVAEFGAKYLNSPESPLFSKGQTLFNLDRASPAARRRGRVIVVEGYLDVIALAQAGINEVVAPLGTAVTETQLDLLWRLSDVPLLCFDGDAAGRKAGYRAAHRALALLRPGRSLAFVMLPPGQDPDDIVRSGGAAAIETMIDAAEPLVDRLWHEQLGAAPLDTPEQRAGLRQRLTDLAQTIGEASVRSEYLAEFRRRFDGLRPQQVAAAPFRRQRDARAGGWKIPPAPVTDAAKSVGAGGIDRVLAKAVLAGLIRHPGEIGRHLEVLSQLKLADDALGRLFEAVVDLALEDRALDHARLRTILAGSGFDALATELLRADQLSFSFTVNGTEPQRAHGDLDEAIAILVARPEVDAALAAATAALQAVGRETIGSAGLVEPGQTSVADRSIDDAFARQVALVREQQALAARLANLVQANEDARSDGIEGR